LSKKAFRTFLGPALRWPPRALVKEKAQRRKEGKKGPAAPGEERAALQCRLGVKKGFLEPPD